MPRLIRDYRGQYLRLTDERLEHIVRQHPEAAKLGVLAIEDIEPDGLGVRHVALPELGRDALPGWPAGAGCAGLSGRSP